MAVTFRPLSPPTDAEMLALHELNPGYKVERLADGRLLVSPTGARGGSRNSELTRQLANHCRATRAGRVFDSSTGFHLPDGSLLSPDGAFVAATRWSALTPEQQELYFPGAPDAAFEIISRTDDLREQHLKAEAFAKNGSSLVIVIDPFQRIVEQWADGEHKTLGDVERVECAATMPGFVLDVSAILEA